LTTPRDSNSSSQKPPRKVDKFISTIYRKIEEGGFTLVVEDPLGKSFIMPYRQETVKVEHLDEARG
jgi:hypothetical protein